MNVPTVSGAHARLIWNEGTRVAIIEDLGSSNGTAVGSPDRKASRSVLASTDTVYLGTHPLPASDMLARLAPPRRPSADLPGTGVDHRPRPELRPVIELPMVSSRHARLTRSGSLTLIEDLGSANGTSVNGQRIDRAVAVKSGDIIGLGTYLLELRVEDPEVPATGTPEGLLSPPTAPESGIAQPLADTQSHPWRIPAFLLAIVVVGLSAVFWRLRPGVPPAEDAAKPNRDLAAVPKPDPPADMPQPPSPSSHREEKAGAVAHAPESKSGAAPQAARPAKARRFHSQGQAQALSAPSRRRL